MYIFTTYVRSLYIHCTKIVRNWLRVPERVQHNIAALRALQWSNLNVHVCRICNRSLQLCST